MNCKRIINVRAAELKDDPSEYFEQMKEKWLFYIEKLAEEYFDEYINNEDAKPNLEEFMNYADDEAEEQFSFKDYEDWFSDEISSACDNYFDMKYQEFKDEKE